MFSRNQTGSSPRGLLRATLNTTTEPIRLPQAYANGTFATLGEDTVLGYPAVRISLFLDASTQESNVCDQELYPNVTYTMRPGTPDTMDSSINATDVSAFNDFPMNKSSALLLGPYQVNRTFACE